MSASLDNQTIEIAFTLNGSQVRCAVSTETRLVEVLRDQLFMTGTKVACGIGRCGACTVSVDGSSMNACVLFAWQVDGKSVVTIEGLDANPIGELVKAGLLEESAFQCGYCAPGFVMSLTDLLSRNPDATNQQVLASLEGNLCRCTGYHSIERGALNAAARVRAIKS